MIKDNAICESKIEKAFLLKSGTREEASVTVVVKIVLEIKLVIQNECIC
jgi:hypothetical protein